MNTTIISMKTTDGMTTDKNFEKDNWQTPRQILELVRSVFGGSIDLDPASNDTNPTNARIFFTPKDDCLTRYWFCQNCFMNPPFSKPAPFLKKLCHEYECGRVKEAIVIGMQGIGCNKSTSPSIEQFSSALCEWRAPRIAFVRGNEAVKGANFNCNLYYFGERQGRFCEVFKTVGNVWVSYDTAFL